MKVIVTLAAVFLVALFSPSEARRFQNFDDVDLANFNNEAGDSEINLFQQRYSLEELIDIVKKLQKCLNIPGNNF